ncbi:hypothetical protein K439DRAFT_276728 [Ramaria rubella]|nr:hypothetical protein K439DRAFT_276728 [Ramaria rubella]
MAAPTQALPPWLTPVLVTVTQDGAVVVQTSVSQLPQTYFGPSIPLDSAWVFGGSTFPASIATSFASISSGSATPGSSSSTTSAADTTSTTSTAASSIPSAPTAKGSHGISAATRLAIILSVTLGVLLLAVLLLVLCRVRRRQQRARALNPSRSFSGWQLVDPANVDQAEAAAEEGEATAFLPEEDAMQERDLGHAVSRPWPKPPLLPQQPPTGEPSALASGQAVSRNSASSAGTTKTESSFGTVARREELMRSNASVSTVAASSLFFNAGQADNGGVVKSGDAALEEPALAMGAAAVMTSNPKDSTTRPLGAGPPRPPLRLPDRPNPSIDAYYNVASSPDGDPEEPFLSPRRLDPDYVGRVSQASQGSNGSRGSGLHPETPLSEMDERATLLTARRVNVGSVAHPVIASSRPQVIFDAYEADHSDHDVEKPPSDSEKPFSSSDEMAPLTPQTGSGAISMGGLTGFARGLGRLSWFQRMENVVAGPSGTRHSSPNRSSPGSRSRPASGVSSTNAFPGGLRPSHGSRPHSGVSFAGIVTELGMRSPRVEGAGSGSGKSGGSGSGSGKSGGTVYHSASSRPRTPFQGSGPQHGHETQLIAPIPTMPPLPPDLDVDIAQGGETIRPVDVLDLPVPERSLPFSSPTLPEPVRRSETASSRASMLQFPLGLISVSQWDKSSSSASHGESKDALEEEPPTAGGDWNSLRSRASAGDVRNDANEGAGRGGLVTRDGSGQASTISLAVLSRIAVLRGTYLPAGRACACR